MSMLDSMPGWARLLVFCSPFILLVMGNDKLWSKFKNLFKRTPSYTRQPSLYTDGEIRFARTLVDALGKEFMLHGKVRVADLLAVSGALASAKDKRAAFNKISSKHVDFVVLHKQKFSVVCAIELDDKSHDRKDRQDRDKLLNSAFKEANLPLLRIPTSKEYSAKSIRNLILKAAKASNQALADLNDELQALAAEEANAESPQPSETANRKEPLVDPVVDSPATPTETPQDTASKAAVSHPASSKTQSDKLSAVQKYLETYN